jgi:hypothetical protein
MPRLRGERDVTSAYAHAEAGYATEGRWQKIVRDARYKLIFAPFTAEQRYIGGRGQPYALFDLIADPMETVDLREREPEVFARLDTELYAWWKPDSFDPLLDPDDTREETEVSPETIEQLKALGYLQ